MYKLTDYRGKLRVDPIKIRSFLTLSLSQRLVCDRCRGTVALVHTECLERWLTESGRVRCELCGYKYATKRVRRYSLFRSVVIWFRTVIATRQVSQIVSSRFTLFSFRAFGLKNLDVRGAQFH